MIFPKINNIYEYDGQKVHLWQQDLFRKVYLKTIPEQGGAYFRTENWWKFMFTAKFIEQIKKLSSAY